MDQRPGRPGELIRARQLVSTSTIGSHWSAPMSTHESHDVTHVYGPVRSIQYFHREQYYETEWQ